MSYLMTWNLRIHSPATAMMALSMANSRRMHGECMGWEQSRIGILIQSIQWSHILFLFNSRT